MIVKQHADAAQEFIKDEARTDWHDETLWFVRNKRDKAVNTLPEWEILREWASQIKNHTLSNLDHYLKSFEEKAVSNGINVHWAASAEDHNRIVHKIIADNKIDKIVKSKSMLTEECHLNDYLQNKGIQILDSDLGEYIVQLRKETPSHIVLPAIHLKRQDVSETFHEHLNTEKGNYDPQYLAGTARHYLRDRFIEAELAITGVNFAIAESGGFVVCTNEGNADMGAHLCEVQIASMGLEKIIPERKHLGVFLRLLARSAIGQPITIYSSHFRKPRPGQEMHLILVDKGRSELLARPDFRDSLKCIKCGSCMNTCPVYRKSGGLSYHNTISGPIGAILAPNLDMKKHADLPFASTLCGSCTNVCPVKIPIHEQLYKWRQVIVKEGYSASRKTFSMKAMALTLSSPEIYNTAGKTGRWILNHAPFAINNKFNPWYKQRDMPDSPEQSFGEWYSKNVKKS